MDKAIWLGEDAQFKDRGMWWTKQFLIGQALKLMAIMRPGKLVKVCGGVKHPLQKKKTSSKKKEQSLKLMTNRGN